MNTKLTIETLDDYAFIPSEKVLDILSQKTFFFETIRSGRWEDTTSLKIPFMSSEFITFQNYIINGEIPHTSVYHQFQKVCDYFYLKESMESKDVNDLFHLSDIDLKIKNEEYHIDNNKDSTLIIDYKQSHIEEYEKYEELNNMVDIIKFKDGCFGLKSTNYIYSFQTAVYSKTKILSDFYREIFKNLKKYNPQLPVVMAGGCVLSMYNDFYMASQQDLNLFFITQKQEDVISSIKYISDYLITNYGAQIIFVRTQLSIKLYVIIDTNFYIETIDDSDLTHNYEPDKILITWNFTLTLYESINQLLTGFDIDCCCIAYDGIHYYGMPRFVRSHLTTSIIVDPDRQHIDYPKRLSKYMNRGLLLKIPGLNPSKINKKAIKPTSKGLAKVLYHICHNNTSYSSNELFLTLEKFVKYNQIGRHIFVNLIYVIFRKKKSNILDYIISDNLSDIMTDSPQSIRLKPEHFFNSSENINLILSKLSTIKHNLTSNVESQEFEKEDWYFDIY